MRCRARFAFTVAAAIAALAAAAPGAQAATERASFGPLTAQMSYTPVGIGFKNLYIGIARNGVTLLEERPGRQCEFCGPVWPGGDGDRPSVYALNLDRTAEPEAVFDLYSGGAHCCWYSLIYRYDPATNTYSGIEHHWFNASYRFVDPHDDGTLEFRSRDDRFAYKYAPFAFSEYPPQLWRYEAGEMHDVTRDFPRLVRRSLRGHLRGYRRGKGKADVRADLAAYVADRCLLGNCRRGFKLVRKAEERGFLEKTAGFGPGGKRFIRNLRRFLDRLGYL